MAARSKQLDPGAVPLRERDGTSVWAVLTRLTQLLLLLAVVTAIFLWFFPVWQDLQKRQQQRAAVEARIAEETSLTDAHREEIHFLKNSPEYVERQARERLNLGRPGEVIFRFDSYAKSRELSEAAAGQP
ncbi:MAG: septum formation initiator family protein [Verrucomicrobiota bacterium]